MTRSTSLSSLCGIVAILCCLAILPSNATGQADHQSGHRFGGSLPERSNDLMHIDNGVLNGSGWIKGALVPTDAGDALKMNVYANEDLILKYHSSIGDTHGSRILESAAAEEGRSFSTAAGNVHTTASEADDEGVCTAQGGALEAPANRSFCVGTGEPFGIFINAVGGVGTFHRWALINAAGDLVATRSVNSIFNLDIYPPGNYTIRYVRHEADVTNFSAVSNVSQIGLLNGCFSIASNAISLFLRPTPDGGVLSANGPTEVCTGQGPQTSVSVSVSGNVGENNVFALVSMPAQTLLASNTTGIFNLNNLPAGNYAAAHLSYQQGVNLVGVSNPSQLKGCYDLSNIVQVSLEDCPDPGLIAYPNPTQSVSHISFSSPRSGFATLEVHDMNGRRVAQLFAGELQEDKLYQRDFQGVGLPNGVYIIRLTLQDEVVVHKLIVGH